MSIPASLEKLLVLSGVIEEEGAVRASAYASERSLTFAQAVEALGLAPAEKVFQAMAECSGLPIVTEIDPAKIPSEIISPVPIQFARRNRVLPLSEENGVVTVAFADTGDLDSLTDLKVIYGGKVRAVLAPAEVIVAATNRAFELGSDRGDGLMEGISESDLAELAHELEEPKDLLDAADEAPVIRFVNGVLFQAIKDRASDVHIEPFERELIVRYRIDGVLYRVLAPPKQLHAAIVSRVKVMAGLDIAEKRLPQDGRIRIKIAGKDIDIRVSVLPTGYGERVVMRLLDKSAVVLRLEELGLEDARLETFKKLIARPHGILLVTGPTGSGKTTTLYSALARINREDVNIITVEDPIEYQLKGIGQIQVNPKIELTFAAGLRSILRQDPDVIMVGEIRDVETADIAIQASLTGHLVFSTLHTNDASGAVTRLIEMGIEPFLVTSSVVAILAQRLVRVLCKECREPYVPTDEELRELGIGREKLLDGVLYRAAGCLNCKETGYRGRLGIYELLVVTDAIRNLVMRGANANEVKAAAVAGGMLTLRHDGAWKAARGITCAEEVMRVTQEETALDEV